jgi:predicted nucleic acid-binding protein
MPDPFFYWDSCVFLSYINGDDPSRMQNISALLEDAEKGKLRIATSTLSVAEVAYARQEQDNAILDPIIEAQIDALWTIGGPVTLADVSPLVAESARDLIRLGIPMQPDQWKLKPEDAIHLATAQLLQVDAVHTYDDKWDRYASIIGQPVSRPVASNPQLGLPS